MRSVASLSQRRPGFDPVKIHIKFAVDKVVLGILQFPPGNIIPTVIHTHLHLHAAVTRRATG
jgi:hypothetical protein